MKKTFIYLLFCSYFGYAQSPILSQYIEEGLESNIALKQQNLEIEKAVKAIDIARSELFPKIAFSPNYMVAMGGRSIEFPVGDLLNPVYSTLNELTGSNDFPQVENQEINFVPHNYHETKLTFSLPLFNSNIKYNILLQKDFVQSEEAKKSLLEYELKYNIEVAYYQYLQSLEAIKIYDQSLGFLEEFLEYNQKLVDNDVALKDVVYSGEFEINKVEYQKVEARKNNLTAKAYFNFLINKNHDTNIQVDTVFYNSIPLSIELEMLHTNALEKRPEFHQLRTGVNINNTLLTMQEKDAKLPRFYVGGSTGFEGYGYTFKDQGFAIGQVGLKWDLFHGNEKKHKIQQTQIQKNILLTQIEDVQQQVKLQVTEAYFSLLATTENLSVSESAFISTQNLLEIIDKKYRNGDALYVEVLKAQNDNLVSELTASLGKYNIWVKKAELDKVSGI